MEGVYDQHEEQHPVVDPFGFSSVQQTVVMSPTIFFFFFLPRTVGNGTVQNFPLRWSVDIMSQGRGRRIVEKRNVTAKVRTDN